MAENVLREFSHSPFNMPYRLTAWLHSAGRVQIFIIERDAQVTLEEKTVNEIVRRILSVAAPDKIILFGSAATGKMTRDSDIDLLVIAAEPGNQRKESTRLRKMLGGLGYPFDVIVISTEWFEESKDVIGGIAYPADKYGKVIYEAA